MKNWAFWCLPLFIQRFSQSVWRQTGMGPCGSNRNELEVPTKQAYFMCMNVLPVCVYVHHMCMVPFMVRRVLAGSEVVSSARATSAFNC